MRKLMLEVRLFDLVNDTDVKVNVDSLDVFEVRSYLDTDSWNGNDYNVITRTDKGLHFDGKYYSSYTVNPVIVAGR